LSSLLIAPSKKGPQYVFKHAPGKSFVWCEETSSTESQSEVHGKGLTLETTGFFNQRGIDMPRKLAIALIVFSFLLLAQSQELKVVT
jgi:hypothetical protein